MLQCIYRKEVDSMQYGNYLLESEDMVYRHKLSSGERFSMHIHNMYELIYFMGGSATHVIEDRKYKLKKGDLVLIRPASYHFIQMDTPEEYERCNILFDPQRHHIESVFAIPEDMEVVNIRGNAILEDIFRKCEFYRKYCTDEVFQQLLSHLLSELFYNLSLFPAVSTEDSTSVSPQISDALRYINDHLCTLSGIGEIAKYLFTSESNLFRIFKRELHQTPKKYIMEKRLLLARRMIASGEKPIEVAEKCGFGDYTTFYRNYIAAFGHSPSVEK